MCLRSSNDQHSSFSIWFPFTSPLMHIAGSPYGEKTPPVQMSISKHFNWISFQTELESGLIPFRRGKDVGEVPEGRHRRQRIGL